MIDTAFPLLSFGVVLEKNIYLLMYKRENMLQKVNNSKFLYYLKFAIKYLYPFIIVTSLINSVRFKYILSIILELILVFAFVQFLLKKFKGWSYFANVVLTFIINAQTTILYFGRTYLSFIMINNLGSIEDLGGNNGGKYFVCVIGVIISALLPMPEFVLPKKTWMEIGGILLTVDVLLGAFANGSILSPFYALIDLGMEYQHQKVIYDQFKNSSVNKEDFLKYEIEDNISKPEELSDNPNIILIFTEGLSRHIIYDDRNIMSNVQEYENNSIHFINYFNHTFATYNGISGQLYSGWQNIMEEENVLISIQDILKDRGYTTAFINVEPYNDTFSSYLDSMGFDQVITNADISTSQAQSISDRDAYDMLLGSAKILNGEGPFFLVIYTFGTHVSFDSPDQIYGDGSDAALNKFYNSDYYFGKFMKEFNNSSLADNTMIVYTADHASYADSDYQAAFPNVSRESNSMDEIPFFIYYKGCQMMELDAAGRTSLDMAPTVLDFLDISANNYFLGSSAFADRYSNVYETYFATGLSDIWTTNDGNISSLKGNDYNNMVELMANYFNVKTSASESLLQMDVYVSNDAASATIDLLNVDNYDRVNMAVWSEMNGQDDLHWVEASKTENGCWEIVINMDDYVGEGLFFVHPYGYIGDDSELIINYMFYYEKSHPYDVSCK